MTLTDNLFKILNQEQDENGIRITVSPNLGHTIYQAHFPGTPITPGVCLIQMAGELAERHTGTKLQLQEIKNIKFLYMLVPQEGHPVQFDLAIDTDEWKVQAVVKDSETVYAKMSLRYTVK